MEVAFEGHRHGDLPWCTNCGEYSVVRVENHTLPHYVVIDRTTKFVMWMVVGECAAGPLAVASSGKLEAAMATTLGVGELFKANDGTVGIVVVTLVGGDVVSWHGPRWYVPDDLRRTNGAAEVLRLGPVDNDLILACETRRRVHSVCHGV